MDDSKNPYWKRWADKRRSRRGFLVQASSLAVGTAALGLVGCGGDDDSTGSTPAAGGKTAAAGTPKTGGTLQIAYGLEPSSLDPHSGVSGGDNYFYEDMFDVLIQRDNTNTLQGSLSLAESWEVTDPTTLTLHLRKGVQFHDGTPFNSETVAWNVDRVKDPNVKSPSRATWLGIDKVDTPDENTAILHLKNPNAGLLMLLSSRGGAMVSRAAVEKYGDQFRSHPVGTGPFTFETWTPGSEVRMKKNPNYWGKDAAGSQLPYLDGVTLRIIPDSTAAFAALQTGDVQLGGIDPKDLDQAKGIPGLQIVQRKGSGLASVMIVNKRGPGGDNINFRKAVMYAIDPAAAKQAVFFGQADVADAGHWPAGTWVYEPIPSRPKFDLAKAKEYLQASGVDLNTEFQIMTWESRTIIQQGELYQEALRTLGLKTKITTMAVGPATKEIFEGTAFTLYSSSWSLYPEPDYIASTIFDKDAYYNTGKTQTDKVQQLILDGRKEYDQAKRKTIYNEMAAAVLDDAWHVPMLYGIAFAGLGKNVRGGDQLYNGDAKWRYRSLWLNA